jgi:hypothetical protein
MLSSWLWNVSKIFGKGCFVHRFTQIHPWTLASATHGAARSCPPSASTNRSPAPSCFSRPSGHSRGKMWEAHLPESKVQDLFELLQGLNLRWS